VGGCSQQQRYLGLGYRSMALARHSHVRTKTRSRPSESTLKTPAANCPRRSIRGKLAGFGNFLPGVDAFFHGQEHTST